MLTELELNYHGCWHQRWSAKYELRSTGPKLVSLLATRWLYQGDRSATWSATWSAWALRVGIYQYESQIVISWGVDLPLDLPPGLSELSEYESISMNIKLEILRGVDLQVQCKVICRCRALRGWGLIVGFYQKLPFGILWGGRSSSWSATLSARKKKISNDALHTGRGGVDLAVDLPLDLPNMNCRTFRCAHHRGLSLRVRPINREFWWSWSAIDTRLQWISLSTLILYTASSAACGYSVSMIKNNVCDDWQIAFRQRVSQEMKPVYWVEREQKVILEKSYFPEVFVFAFELNKRGKFWSTKARAHLWPSKGWKVSFAANVETLIWSPLRNYVL